jgi:hypothetical protein
LDREILNFQRSVELHLCGEENLGYIIVEVLANPVPLLHPRQGCTMLLVALGGPRQCNEVGHACQSQALIAAEWFAALTKRGNRSDPLLT